MVYEQGLRPLLDFIIGFPEETPDDRHATLKFIKQLALAYKARAQVHYFLPLSGTPFSKSYPSPLDYRTIDLLKKYNQDGISTDWWRKGLEISKKMLWIRQKLINQEVDYQKVTITK
jgi:radical SAM superfamily enzyme YgiQ (UPF0313 family)